MKVNVLFIAFVGVILRVGSAAGAGAPPPLTQSELAAAVEAQQNRLQRLEATYQIVYGKMQGTDPASRVFVPDEPPLRATCRYGFDRALKHEFLDERTEVGADILTLQEAFDGKIGTHVANNGREPKRTLGLSLQGLRGS